MVGDNKVERKIPAWAWFCGIIAVPIVGTLSYLSHMHREDGMLGGPVEGLTSEQIAKFYECKKTFEHQVTVDEGLGPLYNGTSCYSCHGSPGIAGGEGASEDSEIVWVGSRDKTRENGTAELASIKHVLTKKDIEDATALGGPYTYRHSITDKADLKVPTDCKMTPVDGTKKAELVSHRFAPPLFGIGLVNAISDDDMDDHEDDETEADPLMAGRSIDINDPLSGHLRIGRFGLKAQQPNIINMTSFMMNAGLGVSTPLYPERMPLESMPRCLLPVLPPEPNDMGKTAAQLIYYLSLLAPPPRGEITENVTRGQKVFEEMECGFCHTPSWQTSSKVSVIDPNSPAPKFKYNQVDALANQVIHPYSDFLLHYMGKELADGLPEGKSTGGEWRTAPLWGVRFRKHLLHDGRARSIEEAIAMHGGQASDSSKNFKSLSQQDRNDLLAFLKSL